MRHRYCYILFFLFFLGVAQAQRKKPYSGLGYLFFAPGVTSPGSQSYLHYGAGGEGVFFKGLGAGAEIGYLHPTRFPSAGFGVLSVNGLYQFVPARPDTKVVPFVTGGYSLGFRKGRINMANAGGGLTWWLQQKTGLRFEVRDHFRDQFRTWVHFVDFRAGVAFR